MLAAAGMNLFSAGAQHLWPCVFRCMAVNGSECCETARRSTARVAQVVVKAVLTVTGMEAGGMVDTVGNVDMPAKEWVSQYETVCIVVAISCWLGRHSAFHQLEFSCRLEYTSFCHVNNTRLTHAYYS